MSAISSSSFGLFTTKIIISFGPKSFFFQKISTNLSFFKRITFQSIRTKPSSICASVSTLQPNSEFPSKLQEIVNLFQSVQDPKAKYQQLLFYGKNLKPLDTQFKTRENKVQGCVSQVWIRAYLDSEKKVVFEADSDSVLTKGLAALLVQGLSGSPLEEILRVSPDFVVLIGLRQSLTPSRNNGFLNMLRLMQKKALELFVEAEKGSNSVPKINNDVEKSSTGLSSEMGSFENSNSELKINAIVEDLNGLSSGSNMGRREMRIKEKLEKELSPVELEVEDITYQHAGHAGVRGSDGETHFNVKVVSKEFEGKSLVKRHRLIYDLLQEEFQSGLHALSIVAKTPSEV